MTNKQTKTHSHSQTEKQYHLCYAITVWVVVNLKMLFYVIDNLIFILIAMVGHYQPNLGHSEVKSTDFSELGSLYTVKLLQ